jgi:ATPase subunit of ABC transporter with duplicated ATPase domains
MDDSTSARDGTACTQLAPTVIALAFRIPRPASARRGLPLDLVVTGRQRIALRGDNGSGTSMLLRVLAGQRAPVHGHCAIPVPFVSLNQQLQAIPAHVSPLAYLLEANPQARQAQLRMQLGQLATPSPRRAASAAAANAARPRSPTRATATPRPNARCWTSALLALSARHERTASTRSRPRLV